MRLPFAIVSACCSLAMLLACSSGDNQSKGATSGLDGSVNGGAAGNVTTTGGGGAGVGGSSAGVGGGSGTGVGGGGGTGVGGNSGTGASGTGNGGATTGGNGTVGGAGGSSNCAVTAIDGGCTGDLFVSQIIPLDIYIMFDVSGSMLADDNMNGFSRLDEVRTAVGAFVQDPASNGIGVGIGYFGYFPTGSTSCDPTDYQNATVPIAPLPGNAQAIVNSLAARTPVGETPTGAALRGACTYSKSYKLANPSHEVVILLVTDGKPEAPKTCTDTGTCCPTIEDAVAAAGECLNGTPGLKTYVLGVDSADANLSSNMQSLAVAGGTKVAYIVSATGDASQDVLNALNQIRSTAQIPCDLQVPPAPTGTTLDYTKVNIIRTSATCEQQILYYTTTIDQCDPNLGGWYYDNANSPSLIHLCPKSCEDVSAPGGQLTFSVGCDRIELIR